MKKMLPIDDDEDRVTGLEYILEMAGLTPAQIDTTMKKVEEKCKKEKLNICIFWMDEKDAEKYPYI